MFEYFKNYMQFCKEYFIPMAGLSMVGIGLLTAINDAWTCFKAGDNAQGLFVSLGGVFVLIVVPSGYYAYYYYYKKLSTKDKDIEKQALSSKRKDKDVNKLLSKEETQLLNVLEQSVSCDSDEDISSAKSSFTEELDRFLSSDSGVSVSSDSESSTDSSNKEKERSLSSKHNENLQKEVVQFIYNVQLTSITPLSEEMRNSMYS